MPYQALELKILESLGMKSEHCLNATIRMAAGEQITIEAEYYVINDEDEQIVDKLTGVAETVTKEFKLIEKE